MSLSSPRSVERNKSQGELAQLLFQARILEKDLVPLTYCGDNLPYDVVVNKVGSSKFSRVQIKSTLKYERNRLHFSCANGHPRMKRIYKSEDIDYFAFYCFQTNDWFIIPRSAVGTRKTISIHSGGQWDQYKNNWEQFL